MVHFVDGASERTPTGRAQPVTLPLPLERDAPEPLLEQLVVAIRARSGSGTLPAGSRLPSSRALASELSVSRTLVTEAYAVLESEGYLVTRRGSGTFVADARSSATEPRLERPADRPAWSFRMPAPSAVAASDASSFRICEPDPTSFPDATWRSCMRAALRAPLEAGDRPVLGEPTLRRAIAELLSRERGFPCAAEQVMVTAGTTQSLALLASLLAGDGARAEIAVENPGYRLAGQIFADRGITLRPIPVDDAGLDVDALERGAAPRAVYLTPSHQFPLGCALSYARRRRLVAWAERFGVLLIEDDYDSEFRYDGPSLPALASGTASGEPKDRVSPNGHVAYLGTFSKTLAPALRLGFVVAPEPLLEALGRLRGRHDVHSDPWTQRALARYLRGGGYSAHLRRMRRLYRRRRDRLVEALGPLPDGASWVGLAGGLHATIRGPAAWVRATVERCRPEGLRLRRLSDDAIARSGPADPPTDGLVLGFGAHDDDEIDAMAAVVRGSWGPASPWQGPLRRQTRRDGLHAGHD